MTKPVEIIDSMPEPQTVDDAYMLMHVVRGNASTRKRLLALSQEDRNRFEDVLATHKEIEDMWRNSEGNNLLSSMSKVALRHYMQNVGIEIEEPTRDAESSGASLVMPEEGFVRP